MKIKNALIWYDGRGPGKLLEIHLSNDSSRTRTRLVIIAERSSRKIWTSPTTNGDRASIYLCSVHSHKITIINDIKAIPVQETSIVRNIQGSESSYLSEL